MDDEKMQAIAEALLRKLLSGGDMIEVEEIHAHAGRGRTWRIRLLTGDPPAA